MAKQEAETDQVDERVEGWAPKLPGVDLEIEAAVQRIHWIHKLIGRQMDETLAEYELNHGEWQVLRDLALDEPPHRSSPGKLAKSAGLSSGAMTNRLDRLEEAGLVRRLPDREDRRAVQVELTDKGQKVWTDWIGSQASKEAWLASALEDRDLAQLNKLLRKVLAGLQEERG